MKYGRLIYGINRYNSNNQYANLGDCFQTFAIDYLYEKCGINTKDIVSLRREYLKEYKGETIVLPLQGWFGYIKGLTDIYPLSKDITPLFIGYHSISNKMYKNKGIIETYKKFGPIGCRDFSTYNKISNYIGNAHAAYISGCLTLTLPARKEIPKNGKVFFVDTPNKLTKYIPDEYKKNLEYITQEKLFSEKNTEEDARLLLKRYEKEAMLVVTSRLHCAAPCLAMGIPVILTRNYFDDRYGFINKYLKLYTPNKFSKIDWHPQVINIDKEKEILIELFRSLIKNGSCIALEKKIHNVYFPYSNIKLHNPVRVKLYRFFSRIQPNICRFYA